MNSLVTLLAAGLPVLADVPGEPAESAAKPRAAIAESITLRGQVIDVHLELKKSNVIDVSSDTAPLHGFKTSGGRIYTLLKTRRSLALFMDDRLHGRELIVKGRLFKGTQIFEATFIQSVHDGVVHDLYYYCDICAIKGLTPEICACCREPVRLVEVRLNRK